MKRDLLWIPAVALFLGLGWSGLRWFERVNIYHPSREPSGILPRSLGLAAEGVALKTDDGLALDALYIPGPPASRGLTVLYCHGNAGNITNRLFKANIFHRLGLGVLLFDYRGYGLSQGTPSEQGTYRDAEAAYRFLTDVKNIPPDHVVLYGESLGNGVAIETALRHSPAALIVDSAFTSIIDMGREVFPFLPVRWMVTFRYDNLAKIAKVRCPVLVMHSRDDRIIPFRMGRALFEAARQPKTFLEMKGSHDEGYIDTGPAYADTIARFLSPSSPT